MKLELIDKAGAWFTVNGERIQGKDKVKEYLESNPEVADKIEADIRANAHKLLTPQARKAAIAAGRAIDISADDFEADERRSQAAGAENSGTPRRIAQNAAR